MQQYLYGNILAGKSKVNFKVQLKIQGNRNESSLTATLVRVATEDTFEAIAYALEQYDIGTALVNTTANHSYSKEDDWAAWYRLFVQNHDAMQSIFMVFSSLD